MLFSHTVCVILSPCVAHLRWFDIKLFLWHQSSSCTCSIYAPLRITKGNNSNSIGPYPLIFYYKGTCYRYQCVCNVWWISIIAFSRYLRKKPKCHGRTYSWECSYGLHHTNLHPRTLQRPDIRYGHIRTDSICEVFSPYKCSLYTRPHKFRPTMDTLSKLVQTSTFQTPPTPLYPSVEYVRRYRLARCSSQVKIPPRDGCTYSSTHKYPLMRANGRTERRTTWKKVSPPPHTNKVCGGIIKKMLNSGDHQPGKPLVRQICL